MWTYNCARIHIGNYLGGGTNENERWLECGYQVLDGDVTVKKLKPIVVRGTNSEGTLYTLNTLVLYPKTDMAILKVTNGKRNHILRLLKNYASRSTMFKLRL